MKIELYTDGGCIGNPGPGAWAYVLARDGGSSVEDSGYAPETTNNRMELTAVIEGLKTVRAGSESSGVTVHTDSQYVQKGISQWIRNWKKNNWKTAAKKPVKNQELWQILDELNAELHPQWKWVKGHAGVELNERCDQLVQLCIKRYRNKS